MDFRYQFLSLGIPWTQSMPSCDVNAATGLAEATNVVGGVTMGSKYLSHKHYIE